MGGFPAFLVGVYPKLLWALLAGWVLSAPFAFSRLRARLSRTRPGTSIALLAVLLLSAYLRLSGGVAHQVMYDEFEHLDIARHLASSGIFAETLVGGVANWDVFAAPTWLGAHHAALALIMRVFGESTAVAQAWSGVLGALTCVFIFWAALEIFDDGRGALAVAAAWAAFPLALKYAAACDLTSSSLFWSTAALAGVHAYAAHEDDALAWFAALSLALAGQTRPENALLLVYAWLLTRRRLIVGPACGGLLIVAGLALANRAAGVPGFSAESTAPLVNLARQFGPNIATLLIPGGFSLLLLPGVVLGARRPAVFRLAALSAAYLLVYSSFYRALFGAGSEDRFALAVILPLFIAAASGLSRAALPAGLLAVGLGLLAPRAEDSAASLRLLAHKAEETLPSDALVVAFNPSAALELFHRPVAWSYLVLENPPGFMKSAGETRPLALFRDWAFRSRVSDGKRLEQSLANRYSASQIAEQGEDSLELLMPRTGARH